MSENKDNINDGLQEQIQYLSNLLVESLKLGRKLERAADDDLEEIKLLTKQLRWQMLEFVYATNAWAMEGANGSWLKMLERTQAELPRVIMEELGPDWPPS